MGLHCIKYGDIKDSQLDTLRKYVKAIGAVLRVEVEISDDRFLIV